MDPNELLRIVDTIHRDKNIDKETVFEGIEAALISAAKKHFGEEEEILMEIDRSNGSISGSHNGVPLSPEEMAERIGAQTAKQVMIQKIREAERDALFDEYEGLKGQMVTGVVQRYEGGAATVTLTNVEAILPRGEQIPGETPHANERLRAVVYEVRKQGSRVKVILSRTKPQLVQRLFEQEIPEIAEGVIEIRSIAREPGYRTKVAVSSTDQRVDCVGACVGVRGNRIKNIVDELSGERIDIVRYNDDLQMLIPNSLQPAEIDEVILCQMLGRAIVLVREDQLSLAIGRRGQNVRLGSKLCGWDIEIMTREELDDQIEQAVVGYASLEGLEDELAERLVGEGFLSYDDLSVIEPDALAEMGGGLSTEQVDRIIQQAEIKAEEAEKQAAEQRRLRREQERLEAAKAREAEAAETEATETEATETEATETEAAETEAAETEATEAEAAESEAIEADVVEADKGTEDATEPDESKEDAAEAASVEADEANAPTSEQTTVTRQTAETEDRQTDQTPIDADADADEGGQPAEEDIADGDAQLAEQAGNPRPEDSALEKAD